MATSIATPVQAAPSLNDVRMKVRALQEQASSAGEAAQRPVAFHEHPGVARRLAEEPDEARHERPEEPAPWQRTAGKIGNRGHAPREQRRRHEFVGRRLRIERDVEHGRLFPEQGL